jgi:hypothetical protein
VNFKARGQKIMNSAVNAAPNRTAQIAEAARINIPVRFLIGVGVGGEAPVAQPVLSEIKWS